ncbi:MAG: 16S rRNA (adenine(1518)-N(6)/adenine(1519)-N(6))-dimethyltransferase RsmA [Anaerolineales bacterium]|jgi:16S rRNA (adenine1518-N6/adenine1519-N6)-dimethyltransferase
MSNKTISQLLKQYGLKPQKGLGQNFLTDPASLRKIISAAGIQPEDTILEIGPGLGSLTALLADAAARVVAVELDRRMVRALEEILAPYDNVELIQGDILEVNLNDLVSQPGYLVVANIPYYLTSALIRQLLEADNAPQRLVLTVQKEVAERICAGPGDLSLLALGVQVYGDPQITDHIPAGAFYPTPKVDSAVVRVDLYPQPRIARDRLEDFFALTKAGFSQKRKTLQNAISAGMRWEKSFTGELISKAEIDPKRRAQTLSLEEWGKLVDALEASRRS